MPIILTSYGTTVVHFGAGDMHMYLDVQKGQSGSFWFAQGDPGEVGRPSDPKAFEKRSGVILFAFDSIASLDVVVGTLVELRAQMIERDAT